ncbi:putative chromatin remodeling & transcription regulator BTB-POZ family [Arabidopsis thaliana]
MSTLEESLRSLSLDFLNLLINGQAFSDVTFSVEGRLDSPQPVTGIDPTRHGSVPASPTRGSTAPAGIIPVNSVGYEVFLLLLQFLYSGQVSIVPQKHEPRPNCGERGCWHTHCSAAVDLALDTLAASRYFGVEQLALLTQVLSFSLSLPSLYLLLHAHHKEAKLKLFTFCC